MAGSGSDERGMGMIPKWMKLMFDDEDGAVRSSEGPNRRLVGYPSRRCRPGIGWVM